MATFGSVRQRLYHALEQYDRSDPVSVVTSTLVVGVIAVNLVAIILESIPAYAAAYGSTFFLIESISCASGSVLTRRAMRQRWLRQKIRQAASASGFDICLSPCRLSTW